MTKALIQKMVGVFGYAFAPISLIDSSISPDRARLEIRDAFIRRNRILDEFNVSWTSDEVRSIIDNSRSQLDQELFAAAASGFKRAGFFVEFGATNGKDLSNTAVLESELGWSGILSEPGKLWQEELHSNRNCIISTKAVWEESGLELEFLEDSELSTLDAFRQSDAHKRRGKTYAVETISLMDLLRTNDAPKHIDFLSIDTEGSELQILSSFDFNAYSFGCICVEHNYTGKREHLFSLLTSKGYRRVLEHVSQFDDWYILD